MVRGAGEYDKLIAVRLPSWIVEELKKRGLNVSALIRILLKSYLEGKGERMNEYYSTLTVELKEVKRRVEETAASLSTLKEAIQKIRELEETLAKRRRLWLKSLMWEKFRDFFDETANIKFESGWIKRRLEDFAEETGLSLEEAEEIFRGTFSEGNPIRRIFAKYEGL